MEERRRNPQSVRGSPIPTLRKNTLKSKKEKERKEGRKEDEQISE